MSAALDPRQHARIFEQLSRDIAARAPQVRAAVALLDEGATVPFIARYRKEATGGLDDTQLRLLEERLVYLREMEERRNAIVASIAEQGKLTPALAADLDAADTKQRLEDLYAPYKPKRRTRAQIAREAGLEPLADALLADPTLDPHAEAQKYVDAEKAIADTKAALDGARDVLAERFAEDATLVARLREYLWDKGDVVAAVVEGKEAEGEKFRDYFAHRERIGTTPSHRALALFRGRAAGVLRLKLALPEELESLEPHPCEAKVAAHAGIKALGRPADAWLADVCRWTWKVKLSLALELEFFGRVREAAETEAIRVFGRNLKDLLLAPPAGGRAVMGLDPGLRTGVKLAVVDATGKLLATGTVFPHEPRNDWDRSIATLAALCAQHQVELIAIGNGTASRETDKLAGELIKRHPELKVGKVVVSEAGASVYSASALAAQEFPDLDVSLRGAVSIARRLQDPLAELVKIDPKSIGVGQYQHDVNQSQLARALDAVVEDCVNAVGVDVNTASPALLARVAGLTPALAKNVVEWREKNGAFSSRAALRSVPRFGEKTFEQAAGFLRIAKGDNPLDASAVHPEAYPVVERILAKVGQPITRVMGNRDVLKSLAPAQFTDERFGLPTVQDIFGELEKPGRDPRGEFKTVAFKEGVEKVSDLQPGMVLDGVVTNVANFGAFVDIGVHQDGLVHVSALSAKFVKDPRDVVKAGDHVKVKVLEVDVKRNRVALSMRLDDAPGQSGRSRQTQDRRSARDSRAERAQRPAPSTAIANAFARLRR
ncbi:MAG: RNA-binding transcriptional accessory protein [Burkholderiales bacterium]|nr:RNA-binding transcriptional accessory protein [Burkholderiales bacterium]